MRVESHLVDLVLSRRDGDGPAAGGGAGVTNVHLAGGAEGGECGGGVTPKITLSDEGTRYFGGDFDTKTIMLVSNGSKFKPGC